MKRCLWRIVWLSLSVCCFFFLSTQEGKWLLLPEKWEWIPILQTQHNVTFSAAGKGHFYWAQMVSMGFIWHRPSCLWIQLGFF